MEKMLNEIIKQFNCSKADAEVILNNVLNKSNIARMAVLNSAKKEYEVK